MDCNNKYCLWCAFDQCCHESEEGYINATPNQLDCPSALRADFDDMFWKLSKECQIMLYHRNFQQLLDIYNFMKKQEK